MKHKLLSILLCLAMALGMLPAAALAAEPLPEGADPAKWDTLTLQKADGTALKEGTDYTVTDGTYYHYAYSESFKYHIYNVTTSDPIVIGGGAQYKNESLTYPLKSRVTLGDAVTSVTLSDVTALGELSIADGSSVTFTLAGKNCVDHIYGKGAATNMIFDGEGSLTGKHIGGINKYGADPADNVGCNITINSGTFNITAGYESAIGGGQYGNAGKITINGGNITAKSDYGAAIGGGEHGKASTIIINDGEINATGSFGAAIGGGQDGKAEKITIKGGSITARGSHVGAAIGGGQDGDAGTIEISGGELNVTARNMAIGGQNADTITISGGNIKLGKLNSSSKEIPADASQIGAAKGGKADQIKISGGSFNVSIPKDYCEAGFEPKDDGNGNYTVEDNRPIEINGQRYSTLDDAITAAKDGDVITILVSDRYKLNGSLNYKDKAITIKAADGVNATFDMSGGAVALHNAKLTFEGVTFDYYPNRNYIGIQHTDTMTYNNCTFKGQFFLYANSETFNHCTFDQESSDAYNVWTYGAKNVNFNDCTFNCAGKAVLVYNEGSNESTDLVVEDTSFIASRLVDGKAAIEIDTSLMKGQTKITADQATADKTTGFGIGSNSLNSLWNDKKQTAETNKNTTVVVAGKTVFEPTCIDLDAFLKMVESSGYTFDGTRADGSKLTVKWSPVSGCFDTRAGHNCTVNNVKATGNTPARENSKLAQFQVFDGQRDVTIKNVNFVYVAADFTVCANSNWACSKTADEVKTAQLFLLNSGNTTVEGCSFDKVVFTSWQNTGKTVIKDSEFKNIYDSYAIKDLGGSSAEVSNCTFENCGGGIMLDSNSIDRKNVTPAPVAISGNTFTNVDVDGTASEGKAGTRGLLQIPNKGDYTKTDIILDGNDSKNCGPILRQLNEGVANDELLSKNLSGDLAGLGGELTFTSDSVKKTGGEEPAKPTIYTVKFSGSDVADMKVVSGTVITLPTPTKDGYTFKGWTLDGSAINTATYEIKADTTFTAVWERDSGSSGSSTSAVTAPKADHGTVTVSPKRASKGDTVTVTVKPDSGYVLETITVTDKDGKELALTDKGNGKYTFTMPAGKVEVKATFMEDNSMLNFFYDVPNNAYFYEAVKWAVENGITTGVGNDLFAPEQPCTRAQIVTFLWRAAGSPEPKGAASGMTDVVSGSYYEKAVAWAIENGITTGTTTSTFSPDATCTRAQAVTFLARALKAKAASAAEFSDVPTDSYFADAVAWAAANGVTEGIGGGLFGSDNDCTRGQIVTFLYRAYNK